jgi:hypothetical protein
MQVIADVDAVWLMREEASASSFGKGGVDRGKIFFPGPLYCDPPQ